MIRRYKLITLFLNLFLFVGLCYLTLNFRTCIYLIYQAKGQLSVLSHKQSFSQYEKNNRLSLLQKNNLLLVQQIKAYSVDSLAYKPTDNFNTMYDQKGQALLWVITACDPFAFEPYYWKFPLVGKVSYKGFFIKELALKEYTELLANGYDVDLRQVSAWSTLGWFQDPLLSNMLDRSKGGLCNLLFHELFHATYYVNGKVSDNENLAEFIANKATLQFLRQDSLALKHYLLASHDTKIFSDYMLQKMNFLSAYYQQIKNLSNREVLKFKAMNRIADSVTFLPLFNKARYVSRKEDILKFKNAYFIGFMQYNSLQDSLEGVFNKIYKGKIEKLVQDLKLN